MGNNHNLFAFRHEAHIFIGEDVTYKKVIYGATLGDAVSAVRFDAVHLHDHFPSRRSPAVKEGVCRITRAASIEFYEDQVEATRI